MVKLQKKKLDLVNQNSAIIRMAADVLNVIMLVYALDMGWLGSSWYKWEITAYFPDKQREPVTSHHLSGHTSPSFSTDYFNYNTTLCPLRVGWR